MVAAIKAGYKVSIRLSSQNHSYVGYTWSDNVTDY